MLDLESVLCHAMEQYRNRIKEPCIERNQIKQSCRNKTPTHPIWMLFLRYLKLIYIVYAFRMNFTLSH